MEEEDGKSTSPWPDTSGDDSSVRDDSAYVDTRMPPSRPGPLDTLSFLDQLAFFDLSGPLGAYQFVPYPQVYYDNDDSETESMEGDSSGDDSRRELLGRPCQASYARYSVTLSATVRTELLPQRTMEYEEPTGSYVIKACVLRDDQPADLTLRPGQRILVRTGFSLTMPATVRAYMETRQVDFVRGLTVIGSSVHCRQRSEVMVPVRNDCDRDIRICHGDIVAGCHFQMVAGPQHMAIRMAEEDADMGYEASE
jgi:dUTPase